MLEIAVIGFGAIGQELARVLQGDVHLRITQIVATARSANRVRSLATRLAPHAVVTTEISAPNGRRPDLLVECAGHAAIVSHVVPALEAGISCVVASVGALVEHEGYDRLEAAALRGNAKVQLVPGAVGAIDVLAAARIGGLLRVVYIGRKPPGSWQGTPAERVCTLSQLVSPFVVFEGTARDAATLFPKNANVTATIALAGLGSTKRKFV